MDLSILDRKASLRYFLYALIIVGLVLKLALFPFQYVDYGFYLSSWIREIQELGLKDALKEGSYNYTPLYIYILGLIAKLGVNSLYAIKIVSLLFEYLLAFFIGKLLFLYTKQRYSVLLALCIVPLIPTVVLNSSFMSQCDALYSCFVVGSLYFLFSGRKLTAMLFLGIAFSFKLQSVMILPFYFLYMLRGNIKWYYFLIVPVVYCVSVLPAWISGRPFLELLAVYVNQSSYNTELVKNFPNIYQWFSSSSDILKYTMLLLICILTLGVCFWLKQKKYNFSLKTWYQFIFLTFVAYPLFLPGMLERYLYLGDVWALIAVCISLRNLIPSLGVILISFYSYIRTAYIFSFSPQSIYPTSVFSVFEFLPWVVMSCFYVFVFLYVCVNFISIVKK